MNFDPASVGTADDQQEQLNQQLARAQAMRQLAMSRPAYGWGAGLGQGLASLFGGIHESQLEGQKKDLLQKQQGALSDAQNATMDPANQTPEGQRALAMKMMFGDKQLRGAGQSLLEQQNMAPKLALEQQQVAAGQRENDLYKSPSYGEELRRQLASYPGGQQLAASVPPGAPSTELERALAGVQKKYEEDTKRQMVPKFAQAGQFPGMIDQRNGKFIPYADANGQPLTDMRTQHERNKSKAALNIGPDLEPSEDLMGKVENGLADPKSPGMEGPLKELATLNAAAGGFSDVAQRLKNFYLKHPDGALTGKDATEGEAIAQDLRSLYMKNLNMQTLRASDIPILDKVIADPASLSTVLKSATGLRDFSAQLDTAVNLAKQRTLSQAASLGYQPTQKGRYAGFQQVKDAAAGGAQAAAQAPAAATHYLISPDRKQRIPADASGKPLGPAEPNPNG